MSGFWMIMNYTLTMLIYTGYENIMLFIQILSKMYQKFIQDLSKKLNEKY